MADIAPRSARRMLSPGAAPPPAPAFIVPSTSPRSKDLSEIPGLQERLPLPSARRRSSGFSDESPVQAVQRRQRISKEESPVALAECSAAQMQDYFRRKSKESFYGDEFDHLCLPGVVQVDLSQTHTSTQNESGASSPQPGVSPTEDRWILDMPLDAATLRRMAKHAAQMTAADEQAGCRPRA